MLALVTMLLAIDATPTPTAAPPAIEVKECRIAAAGSEFEPWDDYSITFVNHAGVPATSIEWTITWEHGPPARVRSAGRFAPGTAIHQVLRQTQGAMITLPFYGTGTPIHCSVFSATFADGTQWNPSE